MFEKYYSRFRIITRTSLWKKYLRWAYPTCVKDLEKLGRKIDFQKLGFTTLLCGTSGENTSREFVAFILSRNPKSKIIILDIGPRQITESRKVLEQEFPQADISYLQEDARKTSIPPNSIDLIETDGIFEYFSYEGLDDLLAEWHRIGKSDGGIMFRACAHTSWISKKLDEILKIRVAKLFTVQAYAHSQKKLEELFQKNHFRSLCGGKTFLYGFLRFVLTKT